MPEVTMALHLAGIFFEERSSNSVVGAIAQDAPHTLPGLFLHTLLPEPFALADSSKLVERDIAKHRDSAEFIVAGRCRISVEMTISYGVEPGDTGDF